MSKRKPLPFHEALYEARSDARLSQRQLGKQLGIGGRSVMRWELGDHLPANAPRSRLVAWLRARPASDHVHDALLALDAAPAPATASPPPAPPSPSERTLTPAEAQAAKRALEHALLLAAEAHDVPSRGARYVVAAVLATIEAEGVPLAAARALLAPPADHAKKKG